VGFRGGIATFRRPHFTLVEAFPLSGTSSIDKKSFSHFTLMATNDEERQESNVATTSEENSEESERERMRKEKRKESKRRYAERNPDKIKEINRRACQNYYLKHREQRLAKQKERYRIIRDASAGAVATPCV